MKSARTLTRIRLGVALLLVLVLVLAAAALAVRQRLDDPFGGPATCCGWTKYAHNPVLGPGEGVIFDVTLLRDGGDYRMWNSWRTKGSIGYATSTDGLHWSRVTAVLGPLRSGWEDQVNRPSVLRGPDGLYRMWYTGQANGHSAIGYATSPDGVTWTRASDAPVLRPALAWEKVAVMAPNVLYDADQRLYRMWYSGGEQFEPDAIGYATSSDGLHWVRRPAPIFVPDPSHAWEQAKVTAAQVFRHGDWYYMAYIGFSDRDHARIGLARSRDGISGWQRLPANPIIGPGVGAAAWDCDAVYKPYMLWDGTTWLLWYNGRCGGVEQIGVALHPGEDLGFGG